jgi:hypothetical protein
MPTDLHFNVARTINYSEREIELIASQNHEVGQSSILSV